jgi:tetratricopeptide (TPR) repeat protein
MSDSQSHCVAARTARSVVRFMRYSLALFALLGAFQVALGQHQDASASLSGIVHDPNGNPTAHAIVELQSGDPAKTISTRTDAEGKYRFSDLASGVYSLSASLRDSKARIDSLVLKSNQANIANLTLAPAKGSVPSGMQPQFSDEPQFTVAGVKDTTNLGGHGSDAIVHTRNKLAKETASLGNSEGTISAADSDAAKALRERLEHEPNNAEIHNHLASLEERLGNPLEAVRQYQRAAELNPTEPYLFDWGSDLLLHHAPEPAIEVFSKGNRSFPRSVRILLGLGASHFSLGSNDQAVREICQASDLSPDSPEPYLFLGKILSTEKTIPANAVEKLHRFVRLQPQKAEANYYYAVALLKQQNGAHDGAQISEIESLLNRAIQFDPKFAAAYLQVGIVYSDRHENSQAIAAFEKAAQTDPQLEEAHYRLAQVYRQLGESDKSKRELQTYELLSKESEQKAERERHEIRQFIYTLRDGPVDDKSR